MEETNELKISFFMDGYNIKNISCVDETMLLKTLRV